MTTRPTLPESQLGPAERLLALVLNSSAHLWHNRPGLDVNGRWEPASDRTRQRRPNGRPVRPGLFVPAAAELYRNLLEIYRLNGLLMAHFAGYALLSTEWRDLKVACAALMLVQPRAGQPVREADGTVAFHDDDWRQIGEAMLLGYQKESKRMLTPKGVLRVAELLETPEIAALNRQAGFASPSSKKPPLGRWPSAARQWLAFREQNPALLEGLAKAGYKETIKRLARKCGYKPASPRFFEVLGWAQKQTGQGHRQVGLAGLSLEKRARFDGLSEAEVCERIAAERLSWKDAVGRLPAGMGLTPAIMAALLPSLSDRDLRLLTPTLESLGLLQDAEVKARWERAVHTATDQRALNIARNVRDQGLKQQLEQAADRAVQQAVAEATRELDVRVMFLIDKSGSMQDAIAQSLEAISRILAGFPPDRLHVASFDTTGTVLVPKAASRTAVQHMLQGISAGGGTAHLAAINAFARHGVKVPDGAQLVVLVAGDEAGEDGSQLAAAFREHGYRPAAFAVIACGAHRPHTVQACAAELSLPYSVIQVEHFQDPYQVPRALQALLEAPPAVARAGGPGASRWVEKVLSTPLLTKP